MPNHFHLVLWPQDDSELSKFMYWLTAMHARRWQSVKGTEGHGHVYQGRFKALVVSADSHLVRVCRYVEQNPLRAGLVDRAEEWQWSSLSQRIDGLGLVQLTPWPVPQPEPWLEIVNTVPADDTAEIRRAIAKSAPYGPDDWRKQVVSRLGLENTLNPAGRPRTRSSFLQSEVQLVGK